MMYKLLTNFVDNESDEIILNKIKNGLTTYFLTARNRCLILDFLLTDKQLLCLARLKMVPTFEGNKRRLTIDRILKTKCRKYFHFAYLNEMFTLKDSEEIKEALEKLSYSYTLDDKKINVDEVFYVREREILFTPAVIGKINTSHSSSDIGKISVYPDGSMKAYNFLKDKYDKFFIRIYTTSGTQEETNEINKIQEFPRRFIMSPIRSVTTGLREIRNVIDGFNNEGQKYMQECINLFPDMRMSKKFGLFLEYLDRIKKGLYSSKYQKYKKYQDVTLVFQN